MFNWSALNPSQVKGTVFNEINDEKLADVLDLTYLEEMFRLGEPTTDSATDSTTAAGQHSPVSSNSSTTIKENSNKNTLLGTKRLQNIG